jgi:hypothetical protein
MRIVIARCGHPPNKALPTVSGPQHCNLARHRVPIVPETLA